METELEQLWVFFPGRCDWARRRQTVDVRETWEERQIAWTSSSSGKGTQRPQVPPEVTQDSCGSLGPGSFPALPPTVILFWSL